MKAFCFRALAIFFLFFSFSSRALSPEERLPNQAQEQRAMNLFLQIRCLVCSGQVIESSDTEFSFEMRKLVRDKISAGKTDEEIKQDLVAEYGEDILVNPSIHSYSGIFLWLAPLVFAALVPAFLLKKSNSKPKSHVKSHT
jgi:cytochrome c-type biogenesis protein CcmH